MTLEKMVLKVNIFVVMSGKIHLTGFWLNPEKQENANKKIVELKFNIIWWTTASGYSSNKAVTLKA